VKTQDIVLICACIVLSPPASRAAAQNTQPPSPAPAPEADSGVSTSAPLELRLAYFTMPTRRTVATNSANFDQSSPSISGVELVLRSLDGPGLLLRYATASSPGGGAAGGALTNLDGRLQLGGRNFVIELGYLQRTTVTAGTNTSTGFGRGGFRTDLRFGSSGVIAGFAASYLRTIAPDKTTSREAYGIDGETSILYAPPKYPVYVQLGFRRETMKFSTKGFPDTPEEMSTMFLGIGFQLGLR
jgi:hypothetical protein